MGCSHSGRVQRRNQPINDEHLFRNIPIPPNILLLSLPRLACMCGTVTRNFVRFTDVTRQDTSTWGRESRERTFLNPVPNQNPFYFQHFVAWRREAQLQVRLLLAVTVSVAVCCCLANIKATYANMEQRIRC